MFDATFFKRVTIEAFRGFRDLREIEMEASAVILSGPNGTGKTSFFDAIQWLMLGRVERLEPLRERRNEEHIVNHYRLSESAVVEAEIVVGDREIRLRRSGRHDSSLLEWEEAGQVLAGKEAEIRLQELSPSRNVTLSSALLTSGLLQQDAMRSLLEAKASERYRHMAGLLGMQVLEEFEKAVRQYERDQKGLGEGVQAEIEQLSADRDALAAEIRAIEARVANLPSVDVAQRELEAQLQQDLGWFDLHMEAAREPISALIAEVKEIREEIEDGVRLVSRIEAELDELPRADATDVARAQDAVRELDQEAANRRSRLAEARDKESEIRGRLEAFEQLAALAIPLLGDVCPVCVQEIDSAQVAEHLSERSHGQAELLIQAQQESGRHYALVSQVETRIEEAQASLSRAMAQVARRSDLAGEREAAIRRLEGTWWKLLEGREKPIRRQPADVYRGCLGPGSNHSRTAGHRPSGREGGCRSTGIEKRSGESGSTDRDAGP